MNATQEASQPNRAFRLERRSDGVAIVRIDVPGESQNTLKAEFSAEVEAIFAELEADQGLRGVVFVSDKPGSFIAGADIQMLNDCETAEQVTQLARQGQQLFDRIERFRVPVVAAIEGACLGGGLELALACDARIAVDGGKTVFGLPEVMLGLLPGSGGTQRLPRQIDLPTALDLMLTGRQVRPKQALKMGLIDELVPASILVDAAVKRVHAFGAKTQRGKGGGLAHWALSGNPVGRKLVIDQARKQMLAQTHGNYPAPKRILDVVSTGLARGIEAGLDAEARAFGELAMTPEARELMRLYFASNELKKDTGVASADAKPMEVSRIGVLGAGLMGAGIAMVSIRNGLAVRMKDKQIEGLGRGRAQVQNALDQRVRRGSLSTIDARREASRLTTTLDYSGFRALDMVIEAVFEDLSLKHQMVRDIETHCDEKVIFATNTSSIPIAQIAEGASRPERVVGMHYFSPVERMPLLEVIATDRTAPEVVATAVAVGQRQGKTVIVVKDGAGFYVNRILAPYLNEASRLLAEGVAIDRVDEALVRFGFPMGPFALLDEVGLDVGTSVAPILHDAFGERMQPVEAADKMLADGRLGKKTGKGFYRYDNRKKGKRSVDEGVYELLGIKPNNDLRDSEIVDRCLLMMLNEAAYCYEEGVIRNLRDGDIGAIFGIGFPPFRGGPFRYMDSLRPKEVVSRLRDLATRHGTRFEPAPKLVALAERDETFYASE